MMKNFKKALLVLAISIPSIPALPSFANQVEHQSYAQDKLANAQAQLERLYTQKKAINELIMAVKKDLRAAKIRAKAERLQMKANTQKEDAAVMISQTGLSVDLPNLMEQKDVEAGLAGAGANNEAIDELFRRTTKPTESAFYPGGSSRTTSDDDIDEYLAK